MAKRKPKPEQIDGLSPNDLKRIHQHVRKVWSWSHPWRLVKKRTLHADGFSRCENAKCEVRGKPVPKIFVDHIEPVGEIGGPNYIKRMFLPSRFLQGLCKKCHDAKTREENKASKTPQTKPKKFSEVF